MKDNELLELIQKKMSLIQKACKLGFTKNSFIQVNKALNELNAYLEQLNSPSRIIDVEDLQKFYQEIYSYYKLIKRSDRHEDFLLNYSSFNQEEELDAYRSKRQDFFDSDAFVQENRLVTEEDLRALYKEFSIELNIACAYEFGDSKINNTTSMELDDFLAIIKKNVGMEQSLFDAYFQKIKNNLSKDETITVFKYAYNKGLDIEKLHPIVYAINNNMLSVGENISEWYIEYLISKNISINQDKFDSALKSIKESVSEEFFEHVVKYAHEKKLKIKNINPLIYALEDNIKMDQFLFDQLVSDAKKPIHADLVKILFRYGFDKNLMIEGIHPIEYIVKSGIDVSDSECKFFMNYIILNHINVNQEVFDNILNRVQVGAPKNLMESVFKYRSDRGFKTQDFQETPHHESQPELNSNADEILYVKVFEYTQNFFKERISDKKFKNIDHEDLYDLWKASLISQGAFTADYIKKLEVEPEFKTKINNKLSAIDGSIKEKGGSAILRAKKMEVLADMVDSFAQFFLKLVGQEREKILENKIRDQVDAGLNNKKISK